MMRGSCEVCILAGGLSSRMGRDKARLKFRGKSLLARVKQNAAPLRRTVRVIRRDLVPRCGPLGGIYTALATSRTQFVLFLACDMPFVPAAFLKKLIAKIRASDSILAVFTRDSESHDNPGFPFILRRDAIRQVEKQLAAGQFALSRLARACHACALVPTARERAGLLNINRPNDLKTASESIENG
jgi:molybdopterin-guanine dinucleotide biosynthesis protein A